MNNLPRNHVVAAAFGAAMSVIGVAFGVAELESESDGRSYRQTPSRRYSMRNSLFAVADLNEMYDDGWFRIAFRCNKRSFNSIYEMVSRRWREIHEDVAHNAVFGVRDRIAVTLYYLTHSGSFSETAQVFGMSKSTAVRFFKEITDILVDSMASEIIRLPVRNDPEWQTLSNGFEAICGFPNCCLAIDGTLFEIERPGDFFGWYCRKGYPAINGQIIVDHKARIRSYDLRPGSANDKSIFNYSNMGSILLNILPAGKYIVADAGYALTKQVITPYPIEDGMTASQSLFNYLHSRTRITVERTIGILKNRFRVLKMALNMKRDAETGHSAECQMARAIESCFVLHNMLLDLQDDTDVATSDSSTNEEIFDNVPTTHAATDAVALRDSIAAYLYENRAILKSLYN
jgi:hypothetical protein